MIPETNNHKVLREVTFETDPSFTYRMWPDDLRITGTTDRQQAMIQAIWKILNTERYAYPIYSWNYGVELKDLYGHNMTYISPELERRIREALSPDDRITSVDNFSFSYPKRNSIYVQFTAHTIFGDMDIGKEFENVTV